MIKPELMGIVNVTDDSFSDGGAYLTEDQIKHRIDELQKAGAAILDIGVESSNPAGDDVPLGEQKRRLDRAVPLAKNTGLKVSLDSYKPEVVAHGLQLGVDIVNDIAGLSDPALCTLLTEASCDIIAMFNRDFTAPRALSGGAENDKTLASFAPAAIIDTIERYFETMLNRCADAGIKSNRIILDPGMGFFLSEDPEVSFQVLKGLNRLRRFDRPLCVSVSRKSFLGALVKKTNPLERGPATLACELYLAEQNVEIIRTHDVGALNDALKVKQHLGTN